MQRATAIVMVVACVVGCLGKDPTNPGEKIGTFHVTGTLTSTTCGDAPNPWSFDMRLNHDGETLYWLQGQLPISGTVDNAAHTTMTTSFSTDLGNGCSIKRSDALVMTLKTDAAKPAIDPSELHDFDAALEYVFTPDEGSNCQSQLTQAGGSWAALPCAVRYSLSGTKAKAD